MPIIAADTREKNATTIYPLILKAAHGPFIIISAGIIANRTSLTIPDISRAATNSFGKKQAIPAGRTIVRSSSEVLDKAGRADFPTKSEQTQIHKPPHKNTAETWLSYFSSEYLSIKEAFLRLFTNAALHIQHFDRVASRCCFP